MHRGVSVVSVCRAWSFALLGIDASTVEVEVDVSAGLPAFSIVGLPDAAVQEARERVRVAISNSGYKFPTKKVIVNLAPANLRKAGPALISRSLWLYWRSRASYRRRASKGPALLASCRWMADFGRCGEHCPWQSRPGVKDSQSCCCQR